MYHMLRGIRKFPHIATQVRMTWGSAECRAYLYRLTIDQPPTPNRPKRQGFPFDALMVLIDLLQLHDEAYPMFAPITKQWEQR